MRPRDLAKHYRIFISLMQGRTQSQIAKVLDINKASVSKTVKRLVADGVMKEEVHSSIKVYSPGPGARDFEDKCRNRGDIGVITLPPGRTMNSQPPLSFYQSQATRTHSIQLRVDLSRPIIDSGLMAFEVKPMPPSITWSKKSPHMTKGNTVHWIGTLQIDGWEKPACVHYTRAKMNKETLMVSLPPTYIPKEWFKDEERIKRWWVDTARTVVEPFRKGGWVLSNPRLMGSIEGERGPEHGVYSAILDLLKPEARRLTPSLHVDWSPGEKPEIETNDFTEAQDLMDGVGLLAHLPEVAREIRMLRDEVQALRRENKYIKDGRKVVGYE